MTQTLQQMLAAMQGQRPGSGAPGNGGQGQGMGTGNGGDQDDGYSMGGQSAVDMPLFGPERSRVSPPGSGTGDSLRGSDNSSGHGAPNSGNVSTGDMNFDHRESGSRPGASPEAAPPRYRDAVKKYFRDAE